LLQHSIKQPSNSSSWPTHPPTLSFLSPPPPPPQGSKVLLGEELCPSLPTIIRNHFHKLAVLNAMDSVARAGRFLHHWRKGMARTPAAEAHQQETGTCVRDPERRHYVVSPVCDGRMVDVAAA
jgi:hypothetical protein